MAMKTRFRKGTKVEVSTLEEGSSRSWRCAEIIGTDSNRYTVKYEGDTDLFGKARIERVPRKAIRPCPPPVHVLHDWVPGDVVEVFDECSWKMATVLKNSGRDHVLVRLLVSAVEFHAHKYDIRPRICWHNGGWIVIGKVSSDSEDLRFRFPSSLNDDNHPRKLVTFASGRNKGVNKCARNTNMLKESRVSPMKRRLSHVHSEVEAYARANKKKAIHQHQFQLPEKVENIASFREVLHEKRISKTLGAVGYTRSVSLDDGSVMSSVASCSSVDRNPSHELHRVFRYKDSDSQCSDAESSCQLRPEEGNPVLPTKDVLDDQIRRLELHAYRCTIGALYASGPLSWEQELLLTNLRYSLHISNDEHLAEIRNLVSSSSNTVPTS